MELLRLACLAAALLAATAAGASVLGFASDWLDIAAHFLPVWFGIGCAAFLAGLLCRAGPICIATALFAVLAGAVLVGQEALGRPALVAPQPRPAERLTLVQFNIWARNAAPAETARWILAQDADVLAVQETGGRGAAVISQLARDYPFRIAGGAGDDSLILAKRAPSASGPIGPQGSPSGVWARFGGGADGLAIVSTHLSWPVPAGPQRAQIDTLAALLTKLQGAGLVLAGDFNATPWSWALRRQDRRLASLGLRRLTRAVFTWPTPRFRAIGLTLPIPLLPIDQVYAGPEWRAVAVSRGPALGSDHFPVKVVLER